MSTTEPQHEEHADGIVEDRDHSLPVLHQVLDAGVRRDRKERVVFGLRVDGAQIERRIDRSYNQIVREFLSQLTSDAGMSFCIGDRRFSGNLQKSPIKCPTNRGATPIHCTFLGRSGIAPMFF